MSTLVGEYGNRHFKFAGYLSKTTKTTENDMFPNSLYGFNQRQLTICTNMWDPFVIKKTVDGLPKYEGMVMDMLEVFASKLNFTYTLIEPADGEWGRLINGSWTGMVGQLAEEEVDMAFAPISVQPIRILYIDFVNIPFFYDPSTVLFKLPDRNDDKWRAFVDPFQWPVHVGIVSVFLATCAFLELIDRYGVQPFKNLREDMSKVRRNDSGFWYLLGALFCEGERVNATLNFCIVYGGDSESNGRDNELYGKGSRLGQRGKYLLPQKYSDEDADNPSINFRSKLSKQIGTRDRIQVYSPNRN
ncbi:hypothetical protein ScPMuIL_018437 [Solemya velum]